MSDSFDLIAGLLQDPANSWSIGSFGAIGEFVREPDEAVDMTRRDEEISLVTARGGIRVRATDELRPIAWDSLSGDGESWGHTLAFCLPQPETPVRVVRDNGPDADALREEHRAQRLFDLGVGCGAVSMNLRTDDAALIALLEEHAGEALLTIPALMPEILRAQPHRVLISPVARIEVFQPIPPADGKSPEGPHTHLLPKLIGKDRPHSSNVPIPDGWQSALSMHPKSPWRTMLGERHPFEPATDAAFRPWLDRFGLPEDRAVEQALMADLRGDDLNWPTTRRGRTKARIVLRRLAAAGDERVARWRTLHDRAPVEIEEGEEP